MSLVGAVRVLVPPAVCGAHQRAGGGGVRRGGCPGGGRLVVENCTVDASIFFDCRPARERRSRGVLPCFGEGGAWRVSAWGLL